MVLEDAYDVSCCLTEIVISSYGGKRVFVGEELQGVSVPCAHGLGDEALNASVVLHAWADVPTIDGMSPKCRDLVRLEVD